MDALYLLIPISIFLLVVAIAIFFWAVNSDQYSDLDKEAHRILFDKESSDGQSEQESEVSQDDQVTNNKKDIQND